jgi:predicted alpha/beta hydrolase
VPADPPAPSHKVIAVPATITARDGHPLASTLYRPRDRDPARVIIVAGAMAVRRGFYEPFGRFLASQGLAALTFDYRGIAGSLTGSIIDSRATLHDWGERDYPAVIDHARAQFPAARIGVVGHSIGGQLIGMLDNSDQIDTVCTVGAQHGYWLRYGWRRAPRLALLWYLGVPAVTHALSFFPGRRLKFGENLPKRVALQWARSCRSRHYLVDRRGRPIRRGFERFTGRVLAYSIDDDTIAPRPTVEAFHRFFVNAAVELKHLAPSSFNVDAIGHIGFFSPMLKRTLWRDHLAWLEAG